MSKRTDDEDLLSEFEKMLDSLWEEDDNEEIYDIRPVNSTRWNSSGDECEDSGEDTPKTSSKKECKHKKIVKKYLFTGHYFECEECGKEVKDEKTN